MRTDPADARLAPERQDADELDALTDASAGARAIRGSALRTGSFAGQLALALVAVPLMVRHLGPADYGRYVTVSAIVFIVGGITEGGLMWLGVRHYVSMRGDERERYQRNLSGLRLVLTTAGVLAGIAFTWATHADGQVVAGTAIVGFGTILLLAQTTYSVPLQAELRFGALSAVDLLRQAALTAVIVVLVATGAGLVPFFWASVASGVTVLVATLLLVRGEIDSLRPSFDLRAWRAMAHEVLPYGLAAAVGVIYFRFAVVIMSYIATPVETGIYATAFRIVETIAGIPWVAVATGFPILAHAAGNDKDRMRYALQRMFEAAALAGAGIALAIALGAQFAIDVVAGPKFQASVPVLQLQGLAMITVFLMATWSFGLLSLKRYRALLVANALAAGVAAAATFALVPPLGAKGAAIATVLAEAVLVVAYVVALSRADRRLLPRVDFLWKIALAAGVGALAAVLPIGSLASALIGVAAYVAAAFALRAVPMELVHALRRRPA
ncbi:MAG TPA: oligosaccharide flippase family protein [Conexibacter sp.]|nr:oligosaccharide flippase family protein [Conexibacter sp.]